MEFRSDAVVFTITNVGATTSGEIASTIVPLLKDLITTDFEITDGDCTSLAPHGTCTISVIFRPNMLSASVDGREAMLSVSDGATHVAVPLSGAVASP